MIPEVRFDNTAFTNLMIKNKIIEWWHHLTTVHIIIHTSIGLASLVIGIFNNKAVEFCSAFYRQLNAVNKFFGSRVFANDLALLLRSNKNMAHLYGIRPWFYINNLCQNKFVFVNIGSINAPNGCFKY